MGQVDVWVSVQWLRCWLLAQDKDSLLHTRRAYCLALPYLSNLTQFWEVAGAELKKNYLAMLPHFVLDTKSGKQCHYKDPFWLESLFMLVVPRFLTLLAYFTALAIKQRQFSSCHECPALIWVYIGKRKFYTWTEVCLLMFGS